MRLVHRMSFEYKKFKFASLQLLGSNNKIENLEKAYQAIKTAAQSGANIIALPVYPYNFTIKIYNIFIGML